MVKIHLLIGPSTASSKFIKSGLVTLPTQIMEDSIFNPGDDLELSVFPDKLVFRKAQ